MYNIIYLNDHINYYESKNNKIIKHKPLNDTLKNGLIIDIKKFIKSFKKLLTENNIKPGLFYDKLIIITPPNFSSAYKYLYKEIFNNLNYKIIVFKNEISFYKIAKDYINISSGDNYFYYTKTINGKTKSFLYDMSDLKILDYNNKNNIYFIYGTNYKKISDCLEKYDLNYYIFENKENYFINKMK